jgi:hypothetical protein
VRATSCPGRQRRSVPRRNRVNCSAASPVYDHGTRDRPRPQQPEQLPGLFAQPRVTRRVRQVVELGDLLRERRALRAPADPPVPGAPCLRHRQLVVPVPPEVPHRGMLGDVAVLLYPRDLHQHRQRRPGRRRARRVAGEVVHRAVRAVPARRVVAQQLDMALDIVLIAAAQLVPPAAQFAPRDALLVQPRHRQQRHPRHGVGRAGLGGAQAGDHGRIEPGAGQGRAVARLDGLVEDPYDLRRRPQHRRVRVGGLRRAPVLHRRGAGRRVREQPQPVCAQRPVVAGGAQQVAYALPASDNDVMQGVGERPVPEGRVEIRDEAAACGHLRHSLRSWENVRIVVGCVR